MKTLEIIDRLPVGEVVPKRVLAVLKRAKVIDDYAPGGYLDGKAGDFWGTFEYKGRYFCIKYMSGCFYPYLVKADIKPTKRLDYIQFKGDLAILAIKCAVLYGTCIISSQISRLKSFLTIYIAKKRRL